MRVIGCRGLAGLLSALVSCAEPAASLDVESTTAARPSPLTDPDGPLDDTGTTGDPAPPPLIVCASECTALLLPSWTYEGPAGTLAVTELVRDPDGGLVLGSQRVDGALGLLQLSRDGQARWSAAPGLPCEECELEDIALHPSGDVVLSATEPDFDPSDVGSSATALLARYDVTARRLAWVRSFALSAGPGTRPRAGELAILDEDRIVQSCVDGTPEGEAVIVRDHDADGQLRRQRFVTSQPGTGPGLTPLAAAGPTGELLLAHDGWDPQAERFIGATWRMVPPQYTALSRISLPLTPDELAIDRGGRRVELSHSRSVQSVTMLLTTRRGSDPERWDAALPLVSTSDARPALALGPDDDIYVAARTTPRIDPLEPYMVMLEIARWSANGTLRWQARRPLDMMASNDPLELVVDEDDGLVVATVIQGRLHVVRYEQSCTCPRGSPGPGVIP